MPTGNIILLKNLSPWQRAFQKSQRIWTNFEHTPIKQEQFLKQKTKLSKLNVYRCRCVRVSNNFKQIICMLMFLCMCFYFSSLADAMLNLPCIFCCLLLFTSQPSITVGIFDFRWILVGERDWTKVVEQFVWFFLFCIRKFYWIERENNEEKKKPTTTLIIIKEWTKWTTFKWGVSHRAYSSKFQQIAKLQLVH